jgi:hypothetical protein
MSLIGLCVLMALVAALAFAIVVAGGAVALASHQNSLQNSDEPQKSSSIAQNAPLAPNPQGSVTFNGMITDSRCGARHLKSSHQNSGDCARACVRKGASYILLDGDRRYRLAGGDDVLERRAGQRAVVTGTRHGNTIVVNSAAPVPLP